MNLPRIANSLVTRLIIFGVLLVLVGSVARYILLSTYLRGDLIQVFSAQQASLADAAARDVDYEIVQRQLLLERLAATLPQALLTQPDRLRDWLEERQDLQPMFSLGLRVADLNGTLLSEVPPVPGRRVISLADDPDFRAARAGRTLIGRPRLDPVSQQPMLPMAAPLKDEAGHIRAVLIGSTALAASGFLDRVRFGHIGETGGFLLISPQDRLFVSASDPSMVFKPTPFDGVNRMHDWAMSGGRGSGVTINAKGIEEIAATASVPSTGWFVVARLPTGEALATVQKFRTYVIWNSVVGIVIVLLVVGGLVTWVMHPLYHAADQARKMAHGEMPLRPLPVVWNDEVGLMTMAFNRLLAKLTSSQAELQRMAHLDILTGLHNRSLLAERMQRALARAQRDKTRIAVLFMDLDGFKPINDTLGHEAGDQALKEVAQRLMSVAREADTLARVGGDEFVLLAPDLDESAGDTARLLATQCIGSVARPLWLEHANRTLGLSIGITVCCGMCSADSLLALADKAMYQAKQNGRGSYVIAPCACDSGFPLAANA